MLKRLIIDSLPRQPDGTYLVTDTARFGTLYALDEAEVTRYASHELGWMLGMGTLLVTLVWARYQYEVSGNAFLVLAISYLLAYVVIRRAWIRKAFISRRLTSRGGDLSAKVSIVEACSRQPLATSIALLLISISFLLLIAYALALVLARGETPEFILIAFFFLSAIGAWLSAAALIQRYRDSKSG